ncbi:MAG: preprotein translocase subunit SecG [Planctomycetaceae bacterium]|nr:preprotein translocase subunit SecG [Planctomycetaceae bacterium]
MFELLAVSWKHYAFSIPLSILSVFLMLVILVQRGRGGGLTGALGGMGGQSAFGTKAGDLFTRVTIAVAAIWILLSMLTLKVLNPISTAAATPPPAAKAKTDGKTTTGPEVTKTSDGKTVPPASGGAKTAEPASGDSISGESKTEGAASPPLPATSAPAAAPSSPAPPSTAPADDAKKTNP